ncbi:hypothetical protein CSIV_09455 [Microbacterium sp. CSI-V]|nr:hypothetical protein CSIV_09455 [Microbacterium sp. CSI-V]
MRCLHTAELLMQIGRMSEAIVHLGMLMAADPRHPRAAVLMASALSGAPSVERSETPRKETGAPFDWDAAEGDTDEIVAPALVEAEPSSEDETGRARGVLGSDSRRRWQVGA